MNRPHAVELQTGEQLVMRFRRHWILLVLRVLGTLLGAVIPFVLYSYLEKLSLIPKGLSGAHFFEFAAAFWVLVMWWTLACVWTKYYLDIWTITTRRIIRSEQIGLFDRDVTVWGVDRILEVSVRIRNILETIFDFGTLEIQTAGQVDAHDRVYGVPHPAKVREAIMSMASRVQSLEEANRNQEQLLHTISHEVKSYLTKDAASLAYIAEGADDPAKLKTFAKSALDETRKGVSAVMEILSGSDVKSGTMKISSEIFDLQKPLQELYTEFKPLAEKKNLTFTITTDGPSYIVRGDKVKLRDLVFRNLIDNAIRYTQTGSVRVEIFKRDSAVLCAVADTGVGISETDLAKLFTPGGHGEHSKDINPHSSGFGLYDAKRLVEAHGGVISVHSDGSGKGSVFAVGLPLAG